MPRAVIWCRIRAGGRHIPLRMTMEAVLERARRLMRLRHYSHRTEATYVGWMVRYLRFHRYRNPIELGGAGIAAFLSHLAERGRVSASTQNQALSALLFLYREVLGVPPGHIGGIVRAKRPKKLPVVLTKAEVRLVLAQLSGAKRLIAALLYGSGLRLMECLRLRVKDIDFEANRIIVREAKGGRDRVTMLPARLKPALRAHLERVRAVHAKPETQKLYYRAVADQSKIPLIIYNWPQTTGVDVPPETVAQLAEHPNIIAIKESSGNVEKLMELIRIVPNGFQVLTGSAPTLYPSLMLGAVGAILAFSNAAPFLCLSIEEAVRTREYKAAQELQNLASPAAVAVTTKYGVPGLKYAMDLQGYYGGNPRLPLLSPSPEARKQIEEVFREIKS